MSRGAAALLLAPLLGGCGNAGADADAFVVRDSAGIAIAESAVPAWGEGEGWRLADEPLVDIGAVDGPPEYQLFRVTGAQLLDDGSLAIVNAGSQEVRFYGVDGGFIEAVGREGEGPGEFRMPIGIFRGRADSLVVFDERLKRALILTPERGFGRTMRFEALNPSLIGVFSDGSLLTRDDLFVAAREGPRDQPLHLLRFGPGGGVPDSLGTYVNFRSIPVKDGAGEMQLVGRAHFAPMTSVASSTTHYFVGTGGEYRIERYTPEGRLDRIILWQGRDRTITADHKKLHREQVLANANDQRRRQTEIARLEQLPYAEQFAAYDYFTADDAGRLWVGSAGRPGDEPYTVRWDVFGPDGRWLGPVSLPTGAWPLHMGADNVVLLERDDLDVQHVRVYRIEEGTP